MLTQCLIPCLILLVEKSFSPVEKLAKCIDYIQDCAGDVFGREQMEQAIVSSNFNAERALTVLYENEGTTKAQSSSKRELDCRSLAVRVILLLFSASTSGYQTAGESKHCGGLA